MDEEEGLEVNFRILFPGSPQNRARTEDQEVLLTPNERLKNGAELPPGFSFTLQEKFVDVPLEDIDPFYNDTFVVINGRRRIFRFSRSNTFWLFSPFHIIRKYSLCISTHYFLNWMVVSALVIGCYLSVMGPSILPYLFEISLALLLTLEAVVKLISRGLILDKFTYLRDAWNWLDLIILISTYLFITANHFHYGWVGLRALKLIGQVSSLREAFETVVNVVKKLLDVTILTLLLLTLFALIGVQAYEGMLKTKCVKKCTGEWSGLNWDGWNTNETSCFPYPPPEHFKHPLCANEIATRMCPEDYVCLRGYGPNPNYDLTSFDNFPLAMLSAIQIFKLDFWEDLYQMVLRVGGRWNKIYFAAAMFTLSFYMLGLIFAVVAHTLAQQVQKKKAFKKQDGNVEKPKNFTTWDALKESLSQCWGSVTDLLCMCDCCAPCVKCRKWVAFIVLDPFAEVFITLVITVNVVILSLDHHTDWTDFTMWALLGHSICVLIYTLEAILKIIALGCKPYFQSNWHRLEFAIVLDYFLFGFLSYNPSHINGQASVQFLIIFRLGQYWPSFNKLLRHIGKAFKKEMLSFLIVIQLLIYAFAFIGIGFFSENYQEFEERLPNGEIPRWNFVYKWNAYMTVFRSLCGEWIESLWDCAVVSGGKCVPFFLILVFVGNMFTLTLFILLYHEAIEEDKEIAENKLDMAVNRVRRWFCGVGGNGGEKHERLAQDDEQALNRTASIEERNEQKEIKQIALPTPSAWGNVQAISRKIVQNKFFNPVMVVIILVFSYALKYADFKVEPETAQTVFALDIIFTLIILLETLLRIGAKGFAGYFKNVWCWLDFGIVTISVLECFLGEARWNLGALRASRLLMVLYRVERLKNVVEVIGAVAKKIARLIPACGMLWLVFAVTGVAMLKGTFYKCTDVGSELDQIVFWKEECIEMNRTWENSELNFDHVGNAYLSLFIVSTFKGWIGVMNDAVDAMFPGIRPKKEAFLYRYLFFVAFVICGVFLCLSFLLGEAVKELNIQRKRRTGSSLPFFMNELELSYEAAQQIRNGKNCSIPAPQGRIQKGLFSISQSKWFEGGIALFMGVYLCLATTWNYEMSSAWFDFLIFSDLLFVLVTLLESIVKISSLRRHYFTLSNIFDFTVVILAVIGAVMMELMPGEGISIAWLLIIRAVKSTLAYLSTCRRGMRTLLLTWERSLPEIISASLILLVLICSYALCGMLAFKQVQMRGALDELYNFRTFHQSFLLMFQITTGAGWDGILSGLWNEQDCAEDCGNKPFALLFLISFLILCFFVVAYMFLTVVLEYFYQVAQEGVNLTKADFEKFYEVWQRFDHENTNYIQQEQLQDLLECLNPPFQRKENGEGSDMKVAIVEGDKVHSEDVLAALIKNHFERRR